MNNFTDRFDKSNDAIVTSNQARRLELQEKSGACSVIPYMHIGLLKYNGTDTVVFTASSLLVTIKGVNLHHVVRGIRDERIETIREKTKPRDADSDDAQIHNIIITDTKSPQ